MVFRLAILSLILLTTAFSAGCNPLKPPPTPSDQARQLGSYGYTPIDPLPVEVARSATQPLDLLPDTTMRLAIGSFDASGNITYGPVKVGTESNSYRVILDYIEVTTMSIPVKVSQTTSPAWYPAIPGQKDYSVQLLGPSQASQADIDIPVYVGVGMRLTASVVVLKGTVDLSNLVAIGAAAQANQLQGTLTVQAIGISGSAVESAIPLPSTLDQTTVQNALMALGTIKSKMYDSQTKITPRVLAVYNPFSNSGPATVTGLISLILLDQNKLYLSPVPVYVPPQVLHGLGEPSSPTTAPTQSATTPARD